MSSKSLENMSRENLLEIIDMYSKLWLAMDGVWFQSVEKKFGMAEVMEHDKNIWGIYTVLEARRIKEFLKLPAQAGLDGLKNALGLRLYANINDDEIIIKDNTLVYRTLDCRVQNARKKKGMEFHPCKSVGEIEYAGFAREIDPRFTCKAISCYPDITDPTCNCSWEFVLKE
jgi:hypothetical protein